MTKNNLKYKKLGKYVECMIKMTQNVKNPKIQNDQMIKNSFKIQNCIFICKYRSK